MEVREIKATQKPPKLKKVCAYARVSADKEYQLHSLAAQVEYYSTYIRHHKGWEYVGVYADEAVSGTKSTRADFQRMLNDARAGKMDLIITKSITRFARNTITLLETVRELKALGVDVFFEEQNIHTLSADGELMLTVLASYAQEESRSVSENMKWRVKKNFKEGIPWGPCMIGYRFDGTKLIVEPKEAETVKLIFTLYLDGKGYSAISKQLNNMRLTTREGHTWTDAKVHVVLTNYAYTGNLLLQKTYRQDHISKKKLPNNGELPKYHAEDTHEAIIDIDTFNKVQNEMNRRSEKYCVQTVFSQYPLTGLIECGICGKNYQRITTKTKIKWSCTTYKNIGKYACPSKVIPDDVLSGILDSYGLENIDKLIANPGNILIINLKDGTSITHHWKDRSRAESWTPEMKEEARRRRLCQAK